MTPFTHRDAVAADLPRIVEIYNSTVASRQVTADTEPVTVAARQPWFAAHGPQRRPLWVFSPAHAPDEVAGWLSYSDFYGRPAYSGSAEVSIYLDERWRSQGLGGHALELAIAHAPSIGVHTLLGFIFGHNQPSLALFQRFGFATWGHLPRVATLDGIERDLLILGKRLG